jgi:hypothetical protein
MRSPRRTARDAVLLQPDAELPAADAPRATPGAAALSVRFFGIVRLPAATPAARAAPHASARIARPRRARR